MKLRAEAIRMLQANQARGVHEDRAKDVREHLVEDDPEGARAADSRRLDVLLHHDVPRGRLSYP